MNNQNKSKITVGGPNLIEYVLDLLRGSKPQSDRVVAPVGDQTISASQPIQVSVAPQVAPKEVSINEDLIKKIISVYGGKNAPLLDYASQIATASNKYNIFKNNPELLPLIAHLETSSGRNVTRPNNLLNWGINYPGNNNVFANMDKKQVLERAISGLGERSPYYSQFRVNRPLTDQELLQLAKIYEPANPSYGPSLVNGRKHIKESL